jgi:hypothetical protein
MSQQHFKTRGEENGASGTQFNKSDQTQKAFSHHRSAKLIKDSKAITGTGIVTGSQ